MIALSIYNPNKNFDEFADEIMQMLKEQQSDSDNKLSTPLKNIAAKTVLGILKKYHQTYYQNQD